MTLKSSFTSRILLVPDHFGYDEIVFDAKRSINAKKAVIHYISDEKSIKIDQIREIPAEIAAPPIDPETVRIVLIHPLEKLGYVAQEALLKMLEEPPERTLFVLAGRSLSSLSATILSRCQVVYTAAASEKQNQENQNELERFWELVHQATTPEEIISSFTQAPDKKEDAVIWLRQVLTLATNSPLTPQTVAVQDGLVEGYQALLSNVSPKLVWSHAIDLWQKSYRQVSG